MQARLGRSLAVLAVAVVLSAGPAAADDVLPGIDMFATPSGATVVDFAATPIPGGFFDPGSDAFLDAVPLRGEPLLTVPADVVFPVDTIVERLGTATLPVCGASDTVPIEIVALSLTSTAPITVTFGGGSAELWDVDVFLSALAPQATGSMTITHGCPAGGTFTATLPVRPRIVFTRQSDAAVRVLDLGAALTFDFDTANGHWLHADPGLGVLTTAGGFTVDRDGDGVADAPSLPGSSNFFPGLRRTPCTCDVPEPPGTFAGRITIERAGDQQHGVLPPLPDGAPDGDLDGDPSVLDNCPLLYNPDQADGDDDTVGDVCALRHFQCYEVHRLRNRILGVSLEDEFGASTVDVRSAKRLCAPADKNDEDPDAPLDPDHLMAYVVRQSSPRYQVTRRRTVVNQFGTLIVDMTRPDRLLVPTAKSLVGPATPVVPGIEHMKCYRVRGARFGTNGVKVDDQFGTITVDVKKPKRLCVPVDKNGEGVTNPTAQLLCYTVRARSGSPFDGLVSTVNQFGSETFPLFGPRELCVPSLGPGRAGATCVASIEEAAGRPEDDPDNGDYQLNDAVCPVDPPLSVARAVKPKSRTYAVTGADLEAACQDIFQNSGVMIGGKRYGSSTENKFNAEWTSDGKVTNKNIKVVITQINHTITVVTPDWTPPAAEAAQWAALLAECKTHEDGHVTRFNDGMTKVFAEVGGVANAFEILATASDDDINTRIDQIIQNSAAFKAMDKSNKDYDAPFDATTNPTGTNHGSENGQKCQWPI